MTDSKQHTEHIAAMRAWAMAPNARHATWVIAREEARSLFEQLAIAETERDDFEASQARLLEQSDAMRDVLTRLRKWDVLNLDPGSSDDGPYWRGEIDKVLGV